MRRPDRRDGWKRSDRDRGGDSGPVATLAHKDVAGVNLFLALPIEVRLAVLFVVGVCAGTLMVAARGRLSDPALKIGANGRRGWEWLPLVGWWRWSQRIAKF